MLIKSPNSAFSSPYPAGKARKFTGFTLIELSIILVIIGLIVGGVLVGQDMIRAAGERATVTQVQKFHQAVNTFQSKYGYLPGDITAAAAAQFGFAPRSGVPGAGNGNGIVEGICFCTNTVYDWNASDGETLLFWEDLSMAKLIDGAFNNASGTGDTPYSTLNTNPSINAFLPQAKIGNGNYFYVYIYTDTSNWNHGTDNWYGLSAVTSLGTNGIGSVPGLTVQQASDIDRKIDDGLPQYGNVRAIYLDNVITSPPIGASGGGVAGAGNYAAPSTAATPGSSTTCYDNGSMTGQTQQYSMEISGGSNVNCALSFRFQ